MSFGVAIPVGIVVARENVEHSWDALRWRPVNVLLDPPKRADWREVARGKNFIHYHATTLNLELAPNLAMHYRVNLANGVPCVYVAVRSRPGASADVPIEIDHVSASPFEIEGHMGDAIGQVERVPMPPALVGLVERFIAETAHASEWTRLRLRREERDDTGFASGFGLDPLAGMAHGK